MKIIQISCDYLPNPLWGMGWHVNQLVEGLNKIPEIEVFVATQSKSRNIHPRIISTTSTIDKNLLSKKNFEIFDNFKDYNIWQSQLAKKILEKKLVFDVIHCHNWMSWITAKEIKKKNPNAKIIITFHLLQKQYEMMKENPIPSFHSDIIEIEQDAINNADRIIVLSKNQESLLKEKYICSSAISNKIILIPHGINFETVQYDELVKIKNAEKLFNFVFVGRIEEDKGIRELLQAWSRYILNNRTSHLYIAGDGPLLEQLKTLHRDKSITFCGYLDREKLKDVLKKGHIFCLPTSSENLPLTLLEAMSFALVPIFSNGPSVPDIFENEKEGKLLKLYNEEGRFIPHVEDICQAMRDLEQHRDKTIQMSKKAYELINSNYSKESMINKLLTIYK